MLLLDLYYKKYYEKMKNNLSKARLNTISLQFCYGETRTQH